MKKLLSILAAAALVFGLMTGCTKTGAAWPDFKSDSAQIEETSPAAEEKAEEQNVAMQGEVLPTAAKTASGGNTIKKAETGSAGINVIDVSDIVEAAMPQIVAITNTTVIRQQGYADFYDYFYGRGSEQEYTTTASGSGVILRETADELLIVTNQHVVENATELAVTFIDGETVEANVKGLGGNIDIAVIAVSLDDLKEATKDAIRVAKLHTEDDLKVGQGVIAIGNALGYGQSVTVGVISALERTLEASRNESYEHLIQTDAAINPGNSGGALLNNSGELIGINVAKLAANEVEGVGFSIPIYEVAEVIDSLADARTRIEIAAENQGRLGIYMNTITQSQSKALNIPAGVIIMGFSDEEMEGYTKQDSPARKAGLQKNDVITKFDGQSVTDAEALAELVKYYEAGTDVVVTVQRINNGEYEEKEFTVTLGKKTVTESADEKEESKDSKSEKDSKSDKDAKPEDKKDSKDSKDKDSKDTDKNEGSDMQPDEEMDIYDFFRKYLEQYQ